MPIEQLPDYIKVTTPEQAKPLPYSRTEVIGAGISSGLKETTWSYLSDISKTIAARSDPEDQELSESEFRNMPGTTPEMGWYPGMTMAVANTYTDTHERRADFQRMRENTNFATTGYYMLGGFIGGLADPINYIPLGLPLKGAGVMANAARMGGANAAIEVGLMPLYGMGYTARGEELTAEELGTNILFAAGAGSLLSLGVSGLGGLARSLDAFSVMGHKAEPTELAGIATRIAKGDYTVSDSFGRAMNQQSIRFANATGDSIRNADPFVRGQRKIVDTAGQVHDNVENIRTNEHVTISVDEGTGVKTIEGTNQSILKVLSEIRKYVGENESIRIIRTDKPGRAVDILKKDLDKWFTDAVDDVNSGLITKGGASMLGSTLIDIKRMFIKPFEAKLDDNVAFSAELGDLRYEGEFDLKGPQRGFDPENNIGKVYEVNSKTGVRRLLDKDEAKQIMGFLGETSENIKNNGNDGNAVVTTKPKSVADQISDDPARELNNQQASDKNYDSPEKANNESAPAKTEDELKADRAVDPTSPIRKSNRKSMQEIMDEESFRGTGIVLEAYGYKLDVETNQIIKDVNFDDSTLTPYGRDFAKITVARMNKKANEADVVKIINDNITTRGECN